MIKSFSMAPYFKSEIEKLRPKKSTKKLVHYNVDTEKFDRKPVSMFGYQIVKINERTGQTRKMRKGLVELRRVFYVVKKNGFHIYKGLRETELIKQLEKDLNLPPKTLYNDRLL